jgi:hypothetical protein
MVREPSAGRPSRWMPAGSSPEEAAALNEALERRLEALADPELREIALLRLERYTNCEIASKR